MEKYVSKLRKCAALTVAPTVDSHGEQSLDGCVDCNLAAGESKDARKRLHGVAFDQGLEIEIKTR
jgi:hypothetical protein